MRGIHVNGDSQVIVGHDPASGYSYRISLTASKEENPIKCMNSLDIKLSVSDLLPGDGYNSLNYDITLSGVISRKHRDFLRQSLDHAGIPVKALDDTLVLIYELYGCRPSYGVKCILANLRVETYFVVDEDEEDEDEINRVLELSEEDFLRPTPASRKAVDELEKVTIGQSADDREKNCAVCLEEFSFGSLVTKMPCSHVFHGECIVKWLENQ